MDKTLLKGLMILETLSKLERRGKTLEQIAEQVGLTRSNVHRTLQTLAHAGYVVRDTDSGGYRCTLKMFELGAQQLVSMDVRTLGAPFLRSLANETGETVHLSVLEGMDVVYVDKIDSAQPIRAYSVIGGRAPAYAVATGKALLAFQPVDYLSQYENALQKHTQATRTTLNILREELKQVSRSGYATNRGEWREGVGGVAAPVFNGLDRPVAALGISGPLERLTEDRMTDTAPLILETAQTLSRQMGFQGSYIKNST